MPNETADNDFESIDMENELPVPLLQSPNAVSELELFVNKARAVRDASFGPSAVNEYG